MLYIGCPKRPTKAIPSARQSKSLTAAVDDGTKGATASLGLFNRLRKFSNSYTDYEKSVEYISDIPNMFGSPCDIPGFRVVADDDATELFEMYQQAVDDARDKAETFIRDLPYLKQQIIDSYADSSLKEEVRDKLSGAHPTVEALVASLPPLKVIRPADLGMVPQNEVDQLLVQSALQTKVEVVSKLDSEVLELLQELTDIKRVRGQGDRLDKAVSTLGKLVKEFSNDPDVVDRWTKAQEALKKIPTPVKGDTSTFPEIQAKAKDALAIFEKPSPAPQATPDPDQDAHWTDDDELELDAHTQELDESYPEPIEEEHLAEVQEDKYREHCAKTGINPETGEAIKKPITYSMEWDDDEDMF